MRPAGTSSVYASKSGMSKSKLSYSGSQESRSRFDVCTDIGGDVGELRQGESEEGDAPIAMPRTPGSQPSLKSALSTLDELVPSTAAGTFLYIAG